MARDPKSDPIEFDTASLPHLTEQQMAFALEIMDGKTATAAYLKAYPTSEKWPRASVWAHASRTLHNDKVMAWINVWRSQALGVGTATIEEHTAQLTRIRELALASGNFGAAAKCEESRGRASGLYVDKIETSSPGLEELIKIIDQLPQELAAPLRAMADLPESDTDSPTQH